MISGRTGWKITSRLCYELLQFYEEQPTIGKGMQVLSSERSSSDGGRHCSPKVDIDLSRQRDAWNEFNFMHSFGVRLIFPPSHLSTFDTCSN